MTAIDPVRETSSAAVSGVSLLREGRAAGKVIGVDMTDEQLGKAERLRAAGGLSGIEYRKGYIVTDQQLPDSVVCSADLWAACIGGAAQRDAYRGAIEAAGLTVLTVRENAGHEFISDGAQGATKKFGVKSVSILAKKG